MRYNIRAGLGGVVALLLYALTRPLWLLGFVGANVNRLLTSALWLLYRPCEWATRNMRLRLGLADAPVPHAVADAPMMNRAQRRALAARSRRGRR